MAPFNSLLGRNKFPVPTRREFRHNSFKLLPNFEPLAGRRKFPVFSRLVFRDGFDVSIPFFIDSKNSSDLRMKLTLETSLAPDSPLQRGVRCELISGGASDR
jgi:hypothetical protein